LLEVAGHPAPIRLEAGDLAIMTQGQAHTLRDELDSPVEKLAELLKKVPLDSRKNFVWDNGGEATTMFCGGFRLEERRANPLLASLPPVLVVRDGPNTGVSLKSAFALADAEMTAGGPGWEALVSRVSDVVFLHAIRANLAGAGREVPGLVRGLNDPSIGAAMAMLHSEIDRAWTTTAVAKEVGMSRSGFSARFVELVGEPPMTYLARWRLNRAAFMLRTDECKIADVALSVGYVSEAALSRAFKRSFGVSPGAYRRYCAASRNDGSDMRIQAAAMPLYPSDSRGGSK
jgi:AraC family transcriptional regulator, alkane utilization regulator